MEKESRAPKKTTAQKGHTISFGFSAEWDEPASLEEKNSSSGDFNATRRRPLRRRRRRAEWMRIGAAEGEV